MKVITHKRHLIYFTNKEVIQIKKNCRKKKLTMFQLARELGLERQSLWRKFSGKSPFYWLELQKLDFLGILYVEKHEQLMKLKDSI